MESNSIHLRVDSKLLELLEKEAKRKNTTIQNLIRAILKSKYTRKVRYTPDFIDSFAGKPRRKIKTFEDYFSKPR